MFSYPLASQRSFRFPALIRVFFPRSARPTDYLKVVCFASLRAGFLFCAALFSHPAALVLTIISPLFSLPLSPSLPLFGGPPSLDTSPCRNHFPPGTPDSAGVFRSSVFPHPAPVLLLDMCVCYDGADRSSVSSRAFYKVPPYLGVHTLRPLQVPDSLTDLMCPNSSCWQRGGLPISQSSHLQPPRAVFLWLDPSQNNVYCLRDVGKDRGPPGVCLQLSCTHGLSQLHDSAGCKTLRSLQRQ